MLTRNQRKSQGNKIALWGTLSSDRRTSTPGWRRKLAREESQVPSKTIVPEKAEADTSIHSAEGSTGLLTALNHLDSEAEVSTGALSANSEFNGAERESPSSTSIEIEVIDLTQDDTDEDSDDEEEEEEELEYEPYFYDMDLGVEIEVEAEAMENQEEIAAGLPDAPEQDDEVQAGPGIRNGDGFELVNDELVPSAQCPYPCVSIRITVTIRLICSFRSLAWAPLVLHGVSPYFTVAELKNLIDETLPNSKLRPAYKNCTTYDTFKLESSPQLAKSNDRMLNTERDDELILRQGPFLFQMQVIDEAEITYFNMEEYQEYKSSKGDGQTLRS